MKVITVSKPSTDVIVLGTEIYTHVSTKSIGKIKSPLDTLNISCQKRLKL